MRSPDEALNRAAAAAPDDDAAADAADDADASDMIEEERDSRAVPLVEGGEADEINVELLKENFVKFLRREKLKNTPERHIVLEHAAQMRQHFDVDQLCASLYAADKRVSKATVYRTVELLVKGGFIKRVIYGERQARYEWNYQVKYHEHLICANCEFIFEFYNPELEILKARIADSLGFRPKDSHVEIKGICRRFERDGECRYYTLSRENKDLARRANRVIRLTNDVDFSPESRNRAFRMGLAAPAAEEGALGNAKRPAANPKAPASS
jgi:Fur family ferric uptake transcriptional regulator